MKLAPISLVALVGMAAPANTAAVDPADLSGLWSARSRFGPDIRGPLLLIRDGKGWRADLAGFSVPARESDGHFTFNLPDGLGGFRGSIAGGVLRGQWLQEKSATGGIPYATPVELRRDELGRWSGHVTPLEDTATYFLAISGNGKPSYGAFLSNPERNQGRFTPIRKLELDGATVRAFGARGDQPERLLATGTFDAEAATFTLPIRGRRFEFSRDARSSSPFYPRPRSGEPYRYREPPHLKDGWPTASPETVGISRPALERFIQKLIDSEVKPGTPRIHSVLIARHGKLILEEYFHGYSRERTHDVRSAGKSLTATLIGAAMQAGMPIRENMPVYEAMLGRAPADLEPAKRAMSLRHLMTMTSGYFCDDDNSEAPGNEDLVNEQTVDPTLYRYILDLPMATKPGEKIVYCSANALLAGGVLRKVAGKPLPELFARLIARPLQMGKYHLNLTPAGELYTAGGSYFTPRDFLKFPQLMMNQGTWNGRRVLSAAWVREAGAPHYQLSPQQQYGYFWNSAVYRSKGRNVRAVFAAGNGSQIFMAIPELDLAIAFTGGNYSDSSALIAQRVMVPEDILPAVSLERAN